MILSGALMTGCTNSVALDKAVLMSEKALSQTGVQTRGLHDVFPCPVRRSLSGWRISAQSGMNLL